MPKFYIAFPIAGALFFDGVEAVDEKDAIEKCIEMCAASSDPLDDFMGDWYLYEKICEENVANVYYNHVYVQERELTHE